MQSKLIDVSEHQGQLNWDRIQESVNSGEIMGVIIRAGYGTASGMQKDGQLDRNKQEARNRGIPHQFYGFAYPGRSSGATQAKGMANAIGQLQPGESVSLDMEDEPHYGRPLVASDVQWAAEFVATLRDLLGPVPLTYMNTNVLSRYDWSPVVQLGSKLWHANYGPNNGQPNTEPAPAEFGQNTIWQYSSKCNLAGISPVDGNIYHGDKDSFLKLGATGEVPAPQPPEPTPTPPNGGTGTSYTVNKPIPGYKTSADAAARKNSNSTVPAGTYSIFNQANGMINVTRQAGAPGWWINPGDNTGAAPTPPAGNYQVVKEVPGFYTANDAAKHTNQVNTVKPGTYFVFNTYQGMINVTTKPGVPGTWINPADNAGSSTPSPAPQTHTVIKGDTVDGICTKYGISKANNYAQYRALNPNSGHNGDWSNIWPGDVVRVR